MKRDTRTNRSGFTLIELLVVIAIIALLIAILLPSLEAARRQAKLNACLSHIKNIATSSRVYEADDPAGWGIPAHYVLGRNSKRGDGDFSWDSLAERGRFVGAYEYGGKSGIGWQDFGGGNDPVYSAYGTLAGFGPANRPMNEILYRGGFPNYAPDPGDLSSADRPGCQRDTKLELELYKCPGDDGPPRGAHCQDWISNSERSSYDHFGTSYAANIFMISNSVSGGSMYGNSPYLRPTTRVPTPARTLYYEENIGRWAWSCRAELTECDFIGTGVDPGPTKAVRGWHGRDWTFNRSFVDAHAETQKIYLEGTEDKEGFAHHYRNEYINGLPQFPGDSGATDQQLNESYRCIIVRGDGWQKDTFPAELIVTGLEYSGTGRPSYEKCVESAQ